MARSTPSKTDEPETVEVVLPLKEYNTVTAAERLANDTAVPPVEHTTDTTTAELAAANEAAQQKTIEKARAKEAK